MKNTLRILGTVYLIVAVILAVVIIYNYGTVEVGVYYTQAETNPMAIGYSVGVIFQGLLVFCLALGLAQVIDKCEEVTYKLDMISSSTKKENAKEIASTIRAIKRYKKCSVCGELNDEGANFCCKCDHYLKDSKIVVE